MLVRHCPTALDFGIHRPARHVTGTRGSSAKVQPGVVAASVRSRCMASNSSSPDLPVTSLTVARRGGSSMPTELTGSESSALEAGVTGWSLALYAGRSSIVPGDWQIASFHGMSDTLLRLEREIMPRHIETTALADRTRSERSPTGCIGSYCAETRRPVAAGDAAMSTVRSGPSSGSRRPDDCARRIPSANVAHRRFGGLVAVTVCGAVACSSPGFSGTDGCEARRVAVARFAEATVALENVTRATIYRVGFAAGAGQDPNAVAEILVAAGLDPAAVQAAIAPEDAERALEAQRAARAAFALGDLEAAYRAADVMLEVVLDAVEAAEGVKARDAVQRPLAAVFEGRNTADEVGQLRAAADSALRATVYRAALAVQGRAGRNTQTMSEADSTMYEALDAAVQSALECVS